MRHDADLPRKIGTSAPWRSARTQDLTLNSKQRSVLAVLASMAEAPSLHACADAAVQEFRHLNR